MVSAHDAEQVSLHVRVSNVAAAKLYSSDALGYAVAQTLEEYYSDGEDAYLMRAPLVEVPDLSPLLQDGSSAEAPYELAAQDEAMTSSFHLRSKPPQPHLRNSFFCFSRREHKS